MILPKHNQHKCIKSKGNLKNSSSRNLFTKISEQKTSSKICQFLQIHYNSKFENFMFLCQINVLWFFINKCIFMMFKRQDTQMQIMKYEKALLLGMLLFINWDIKMEKRRKFVKILPRCILWRGREKGNILPYNISCFILWSWIVRFLSHAVVQPKCIFFQLLFHFTSQWFKYIGI